MDKKIILSEKEIQNICQRIGGEINEIVKKETKIPVIVGVLKGSMNFMMDLIKYIDAPIYTDYVQLRSYNGTSTTGKVQLVKDLSFDCTNRTVIIIEDIVDTGYSMSFLLKHIQSHNPKKVMVCALFDKKEARITEVKVDFVGKELVGKEFLIGYGLDYNELCRNVPYVYSACKEDVEAIDRILEKDKVD